MREERVDKTALSWWFPKLEAAGLPVPRTSILTMPVAAQKSIWASFDGAEGEPEQQVALDAFVNNVAAAGSQMGFPFFLRTDHTSGKHEWKDTCFVAADANVRDHICRLAYFSECADFMGIPWETWVVREMLPTKPFGLCPRYGDMPINREFRFFVDDGRVRCSHPYWPFGALETGEATNLDYAELCRMERPDELIALAEAAGRAVGGSWSIDLLDTERGWFITDMAEAARSYHWPDCEFAQGAFP